MGKTRILHTDFSVDECLRKLEHIPIKAFISDENSKNRRYRTKINHKKKKYIVRTKNLTIGRGAGSGNEIKNVLCKAVEAENHTRLQITYKHKTTTLLQCLFFPTFFFIALSLGTSPLDYRPMIFFSPFFLLIGLLMLKRSPALKDNDNIIFDAIKEMLDAEEITDNSNM